MDKNEKEAAELKTENLEDVSGGNRLPMTWYCSYCDFHTDRTNIGAIEAHRKTHPEGTQMKIL